MYRKHLQWLEMSTAPFEWYSTCHSKLITQSMSVAGASIVCILWFFFLSSILGTVSIRGAEWGSKVRDEGIHGSFYQQALSSRGKIPVDLHHIVKVTNLNPKWRRNCCARHFKIIFMSINVIMGRAKERVIWGRFEDLFNLLTHDFS